MALLPSRHRSAFLVISLLIVALLLFLSNLRSPSKYIPLEQELFSFVAQIQKAANSFVSLPVDVWKKYVFLVTTEEENSLLRKKVKMLGQENVSLRESAVTNKRLCKLLDFKKASPLDLVAAKVVGADASLHFRSVIVDKGERDGIKKDMAVINPEGVVGRILKVADSFSVVLLLIDQNFALDALVQRSRSRGVVEGAGNDLCRMKYVLQSEDVRSGDIIVVSGLEGVFPKGTIVGKIKSLKQSKSSLLFDVLVTPAVEFGKLEEVFLVLER